MNKIAKNKYFVLGVTTAVLVVTIIGFTAIYVNNEKNNSGGGSYLVQKTDETGETTTINIDSDIAAIDKEVNSISVADFGEEKLNDTLLGL